MKPTRLNPAQRRRELLDAALALATEGHYMRVSRYAIAKRAGCSDSLIQHHLGTMCKLRRAVMRAAVMTECLPVIAQGIVAKDPQALKAPAALRERALTSVAG